MIGKSKLRNVSDHESNQFWRTIAIGAFVLIAFLSLPQLCSADCGHSHGHHHHDHDHHHHHHEEPASFKWTKQANEAYEDDSHHHHHHHHGEEPHDHGHHSHSHAAHSHGSHSHAAHTEKPSKNVQSELKS